MIHRFYPPTRLNVDDPAAEVRELEDLYEWHQGSQDGVSITFKDLQVWNGWPESLPSAIYEAFDKALNRIMQAQALLTPIQKQDYASMDKSARCEALDLMYTRQNYLWNQREYHTVLLNGLGKIFAEFLPRTTPPNSSLFSTSLVEVLPNIRGIVERVYREVWTREYGNAGFFKDLRSGFNYEKCKKGFYPHIASVDIDPKAGTNEVIDEFFGNTPFAELLRTPVPLALDREERFNHMHIVGGTGAGKTSLIESLILHDIRSEDSPSLVVIDPHGDLIKKLTRADLGIEDRLIIIDPRDIKHPPALNVFAVNQDRYGEYDEGTREQVTAGVIQTFDYLFSGIIGADLTAKQGVFFRYVARLMLSLPETMGRNATIVDMLRLMSDPEPYREAIENLPIIPREFFLTDFQSKTFQQTKEQIRYRLQSILENPTMARLFTSPETKIDLFDALNSGKIILVDTAKDFLKGASDNFGRVFISLVLQAVLERAAIPASDRKPVFLIVDEAASYFDSNIDDLLTEARKYKCGLVLAHQYLDQASSSLRASLAANTGAKFASGLSSSDARAMAPDMRTTPEFILAQPRLRFAAHIRNVTSHAVTIDVTPGVLEGEPRLSDEAYEKLIERNRTQVSLRRSEPQQRPPVSPQPDEDISREW